MSFKSYSLALKSFIIHFELLKSSKIFFTADIVASHSRKSTGVTDNMNDGAVVFEWP